MTEPKLRDLKFLSSFPTPENEQHKLHIEQRALEAETKANKKSLIDLFVRRNKKMPQKILYRGVNETMDQLIEMLEDENTNGMWVHITLNFAPECNVYHVLQNIVSLVRKPRKYVRRYIAVFEYYTSDLNHPHVHMLIEKLPEFYEKTSWKRVRDDNYLRFKNFVSDDSKIDIKFKKQPASTLSYIRGNKKSKKKMELVTQDKVWRHQMGLQETYGNWDEVGDDVSILTLPVSVPIGVLGTDQEAKVIFHPALVSTPIQAPPNLHELMKQHSANPQVSILDNNNNTCELCGEMTMACYCRDQQD